MKRYTARDESIGEVAREDNNLSLQRVGELIDCSEVEFDSISELKVGDKINFDGITVERTE